VLLAVSEVVRGRSRPARPSRDGSTRLVPDPDAPEQADRRGWCKWRGTAHDRWSAGQPWRRA